MHRTFLSENFRKTAAFNGWIDFLSKTHAKLKDDEFDEIYEGEATVSGVSKNRMDLRLKDWKSVRHIPISPEISAYTCALDLLAVVLGRRDSSWMVLDVLSIASTIDLRKGEMHLTFNPLLLRDVSQVIH